MLDFIVSVVILIIQSAPVTLPTPPAQHPATLERPAPAPAAPTLPAPEAEHPPVAPADATD